MKPLTTLGDVLAAKGADIADVDWRAAARAADVPRRPPPSSKGAPQTPPPPPPPQTLKEKLAEAIATRPDRGYVEQPEERIETKSFRPPPPPRRREETPTLETPVALIRLERPPQVSPKQMLLNHLAEMNEDELRELAKQPRPRSEPPPAPGPPPPAPEATEMPAKQAVKSSKKHWPEDVKKAAVARVLKGESQATVAGDIGTNPANMSNWVKVYGKAVAKEDAKRETTLISRPAAPASAKNSAVQTRVLNGARTIETVSRELTEALARVAELKAELRALLGD